MYIKKPLLLAELQPQLIREAHCKLANEKILYLQCYPAPGVSTQDLGGVGGLGWRRAPPASLLPGSHWAPAVGGGDAGPRAHCRPSLSISFYLFTHPAALAPPFFGRPGVYQPVSKVTLVAVAGPTCNYTASLGDCCWVSRVLLFNLF